MDSVNVPGLPFDLAPVGAPACVHRLRGEALVLTGAGSTDLFVDPAGDGSKGPDAGRLAGLPPAGDFSLAARVSVEFGSMYDAGALLLHAGDLRWAKLAFEYSPQRRPTAVTVVTNGRSDDSNSFEVDGDSLWLRITRFGRAWAFHGSTDGAWWRLLRYFSLGDDPVGEPVTVGFLAQSPTGDGCTAVFEQITLSTGAPKDLRDGS
jgi:uncharacterized protein